MPSQLRLRQIATIAASLAVGLGLLEGYARLSDWIGYGSQVVADASAPDEDIIVAIRKGCSPYAPEVRPLLVLGDSMAASVGIPKEANWSTLLGNRLRGEVDPHIVVVNAAIPGANTYQELLLAQEIVPQLKPEVVLLVYNFNDVYGTHLTKDGKVIQPTLSISAAANTSHLPSVTPDLRKEPTYISTGSTVS